MDPQARYRLNAADVAEETIDGETVVVNLATGTYYSLDGAGATVWRWATGGVSLPAAIDAAARRWDGARDAITAGVTALYQRLLAEGLIVVAEGPDATVSVEDDAPADGARAWVAPVLHAYRDLQDLLLLDPIHEVDDAGWPLARP